MPLMEEMGSRWCVLVVCYRGQEASRGALRLFRVSQQMALMIIEVMKQAISEGWLRGVLYSDASEGLAGVAAVVEGGRERRGGKEMKEKLKSRSNSPWHPC